MNTVVLAKQVLEAHTLEDGRTAFVLDFDDCWRHVYEHFFIRRRYIQYRF
jgi:hypothetical protein